MRLRINGEQRDFAAASTLGDVMAELEAPDRGIAVALDGEVVPRACWQATPVPEGANVEVMSAVPGG